MFESLGLFARILGYFIRNVSLLLRVFHYVLLFVLFLQIGMILVYKEECEDALHVEDNKRGVVYE